MSDQLQLNSLPLTKSGVATIADTIIKQVEDGTVYPAEAIAKGKAIELAGKAIQDGAKPFLHEDKTEFNGVKIVQSSKANKDYSADIYWNQLNTEIEQLKQKQKDHEKLIDTVKSVENPLYFTTPEGEYYKLQPAMITYTPVVTVTVPK